MHGTYACTGCQQNHDPWQTFTNFHLHPKIIFLLFQPKRISARLTPVQKKVLRLIVQDAN